MKKLIILFLMVLILMNQAIIGQGRGGNQVIDSMKIELAKTGLSDTTIIRLLVEIGQQTPIFRRAYWDSIVKISENAIANQTNSKVKRSLIVNMGDIINNMGFIHSSKREDSLSLECFHKSLNIYEEIGDRKGMAASLNNIGSIYKDRGDIKKALHYFNKGLKMRREIPVPEREFNDKDGMAANLTNIGNIYLQQSNISRALEYYHLSLKIREELGYKNGIAASLSSLGSIYTMQGEVTKGLEYHQRSLSIYEELGNKIGIANCFNNIGYAYGRSRNDSLALDYHLKSLKMKEVLGDKSGMAISLNNIGYMYKTQGDIDKSLFHLHRCLKIYEELGYKNGLARSLSNIGHLYYEKGQLRLAMDYAKKALGLAEELGFPVRLMGASGLLYKIYNKTHKYKKALSMYELNIQMKDSIENEKTHKATIKQNMKYEYEMRASADSIKAAAQQTTLDAQILAQEARLSQERTFKYSLFGGLGLVALFSLFVMNRLHITRKQKIEIELKNNALNESNDEIVHQKELVEHKNKAVLDSITYARRIQSAILPPINLVKKHLPQSFVLYKPKDIVAGDFYWLEPVGHDIYFSVADCTGHGVPGALMSVMCSNALTKCVKELGLTLPGAVLDETTKIIEGTFERSEQLVLDGMDLALCKLNLKTNELQYAGANNPLWIVREFSESNKLSLPARKMPDRGQTSHEQTILETNTDVSGITLEEVKANKQPIGQYDHRLPYTNHQIQLKKGDSLYIFSDGYVDQFGGPKGKKLKTKPFKQLLLSIQTESMEKQMAIIDQTFEDWRGESQQVDDVCVLGVKI